MKVTLLLLLLFSSLNVLSQKFTKKGLLEISNKNIPYQETDTIPYTPGTLTDQEKENIKEQLLARVVQAINNLQDDSLALDTFYTAIWGKAYYDQLLKELIGLKAFLNGKTYDPSLKFEFVPHPEDITNQVLNAPVFSLDLPDVVNNRTVKRFRLLKADPLKNWIFRKYENDLLTQDVESLEMDMAYIKGWRQLEAAYLKIQASQRSLKMIMDNIFNFDQAKLDDLEKIHNNINIDTNYIIKLIGTKHYLKRWTWYNGGVLYMSPLVISTPGKTYPPGEKISLQTTGFNNLADSLTRSDYLKQFATVKNTFNRVELPLDREREKGTLYLLQYDANDYYKEYKGLKNNIIRGTDSIVVVIHNIAKNKKVDYALSTEDFIYQSKTAAQVKDVSDALSTFAGLISPNLGAITAITALINPADIDPVHKDVQKGVADRMQFSRHLSDNWKTQMLLEAYAESQMMNDTSLVVPVEDEAFSSIEIGKKIIPLVKNDINEDKRRIIWITAANENGKLVKPGEFFEEVLDHFVTIDKYNFLDYSSPGSIERDAKALIERFNKYSKEVNQQKNQVAALDKKFLTLRKNIEPYVRIIGRSLPPDLKPLTDTVPRFRSQVIVPEVPAPPKKLNYSISEGTVGSTDPAVNVVKRGFKVYSPTYWDISIGLAFTTQNYTVFSQSGNSLPDVAAGEHLQFMAGIHIYPIRPLNKLNDGFLGDPRERLSIFLGLSIVHALDNYYAGISYDLWPGIRAIGGAHFYRNYRYKILNDQVADKASGPELAGPFISIGIEPKAILGVFGLFK